jgi:hypothetical protein
VYLPDLAMALDNLGRVDRLQGRIEESRDHYEEAYNLLQKLVQGNSAYASEMARVRPACKNWERGSPPIRGCCNGKCILGNSWRHDLPQGLAVRGSQESRAGFSSAPC